MRKLVVVAAAFGLISLAACSRSESAPEPGAASAAAELPAMTIDDVARALAAKTVTAVDCNGAGTRKTFGVVPGAIQVSSLNFAASELPADKAAKLVFYCADSA